MPREDLVAFARRDWTTVGAAKTSHWLRRKAARSSAETWRLGAELHRYRRRVRPGEPALSERLADMAVHQRVARALRAVAPSAR